MLSSEKLCCWWGGGKCLVSRTQQGNNTFNPIIFSLYFPWNYSASSDLMSQFPSPGEDSATNNTFNPNIFSLYFTWNCSCFFRLNAPVPFTWWGSAAIRAWVPGNSSVLDYSVSGETPISVSNIHNCTEKKTF